MLQEERKKIKRVTFKDNIQTNLYLVSDQRNMLNVKKMCFRAESEILQLFDKFFRLFK